MRYRTSRAGDLDVGVQVILLKALRTWAFRKLLIARIAAAGVTPPSPKPYQAWHGYRITMAHHEEVGVSANGPAGAPPSGAAPVAPPAGVNNYKTYCGFE
jgi:hypothetical protein